MSVSGNASLPKGSALGIDAGDLVAAPLTPRVMIGIFDAGDEIKTRPSSGEHVPKVRFLRAEMISDGDDLKLAYRLMDRALDRRGGRQTLPDELDAQCREAFGLDGGEEDYP